MDEAILPRLCQYMSQHELTVLALVCRRTSEVVARELYRHPDLSRCSERQLTTFVHTVKASKQRRRVVETFDLLVPFTPAASEPFYTESKAVVSAEHAFRFSDSLFLELFRLFKNLKTMNIYGHSLYDGIKAHWNSLSKSLTSLSIYNLGELTDRGLIELISKVSSTLKHLHLEHPVDPQRKSSDSGTGVDARTIESIIRMCPNLNSIGIGCQIMNINDNAAFLEGFLGIESIEFREVAKLKFCCLHTQGHACKWKKLVVTRCPGVGADDLDAVLKTVPTLESLEWRFTTDTYYDSIDHRLTTAVCRQLKRLVLEHAWLSDECLMKISRWFSDLELLAMANCKGIYRIREPCAQHLVLKDLTSFSEDLYTALEGDCLLSLHSLTLINQRLPKWNDLATSINWLFRDAKKLQCIELRHCDLGFGSDTTEKFRQQLSRQVNITMTGPVIRLIRVKADRQTTRRECASDRPIELTVPSILTTDRLDENCAQRDGWGEPSKQHPWGRVNFGTVDRQRQTDFWLANAVSQSETPSTHHARQRPSWRRNLSRRAQLVEVEDSRPASPARFSHKLTWKASDHLWDLDERVPIPSLL